MRVRLLWGLSVLIGLGIVTGCNPPATEPLPRGTTREFVLIISDLRFIGESPLAIAGTENPDLVVQVGDRVKITIKNKESQLVLHDFAVSNHDVRLPHYLRPNQTITVEFIAPRVGEFFYYDPLHPTTMRGRFIVIGR